MTYAERRALAAKRLANPELYSERVEHQQQQLTSQRSADSAIDRGLVQWWK